MSVACVSLEMPSDEPVEYVYRKGKGWCPFPSYCEECGGVSKYCCEASPYYDTDEYWWAAGKRLEKTMAQAVLNRARPMNTMIAWGDAAIVIS